MSSQAGLARLAQVIWKFVERFGPRFEWDLYEPSEDFKRFLLDAVNVRILEKDYFDEFLTISEEARRKRVQRAVKLLDELGIVRVEPDGSLRYWAHKWEQEQIAKILDEWREEFKDKPYIRPLKIEELTYRLRKDPESEEAKGKIREIAIRYGWPPFQRELHEHSKSDLKEALEGWLERLEPRKGVRVAELGLEDFCGLTWLDLYGSKVLIFPLQEPGVEDSELFESLKQLKRPFEEGIKGFNLLRQHLEGQKIVDDWVQLCGGAHDLLSSAKRLLEKIADNVSKKAEELNVPMWAEGREEGVFANNCISLVYRSVKGEVVLDPQKDIKVDPEAGRYIVQPGPLCVTRDPAKAESFAEFTRQQMVSKEYLEQAGEIGEKREALQKDTERFKKSLRELIAKIDDGFYLKGSCEKCKHLHAHHE